MDKIKVGYYSQDFHTGFLEVKHGSKTKVKKERARLSQELSKSGLSGKELQRRIHYLMIAGQF